MASSQPEPIAVVGSGCRFPGSSSSPSALWKLLEKPRDVSKSLSEHRFELNGYYHPKGSHHGTTNVQRAYMLDEDVRAWDATFFNISPNEAESIDPQHRLLMEAVYEALESGGHRVEKMRGSDTSVFVGTMSVDYNDIMLRDIHSTPTYFSTGTSRAILANRISYFFDWHGPSMTIDTACSSSMVALHESVMSLRSGECRVAVAGGTELLLGPEQFVGESKMSLLSPTGQSRMWDADANGYARGDGIAAVVMKRLSDAIADGDHIECLIRQTGVNQDGKSTGLTVPSSEAQAALIRTTYARGGLDMSNPKDWPQYFEAHGTGTKAGDPREASAIDQCFGSQPINGNPLYVGSIKTIIGHTEGTAGLAGVLKASLAIQHGLIPPNMLLNRMNPDVAQYCRNLEVPQNLIAWPELPEGVPRRASVNSFGFGGTNGHAIVEGYLPAKAQKKSSKATAIYRPFPFSASTDAALVASLQAYQDFLKSKPEVDLADLAFTLQSRRSALPFKVSLSASTMDNLLSKITERLDQVKANSGSSLGIRSAPAKLKILGVFTGQGAQWPTMGAHLIKSSKTFRKVLEELDQSLAALPEADRPSWKIAEQLSADKDSRLSEAALSQPLCTAVQVALIDLLRSAGISFHSVVGHSSGEIAAAYAADFITAHDAIRIAYYRGVHAKLAKGPSGQKGAMMAVGTSWEDATELLNLPAFRGRVKIAAQNSGSSLTLSGDADGVAHVKKVFDEEKKFARALAVDTAYHSHHMLQCSDAYINSLRTCGVSVNYSRDTSTTWYSSVKHGKKMEPSAELCDQYWNDNMVNAVLFADAVKGAAEDKDINLAIEVGPHPALKGPAMQSLSDTHPSLPYTGVLKRKGNDVEAFSDALGFIWTQFGPDAVNIQSYEKHAFADYETPTMLSGLPSYQWDHSRGYWFQSRLAKKVQERGQAFHELLGVPSPNNTEIDLRWTNLLKTTEIPWLDGHSLQGQTIFPAAGYVAMALEAGRKLAGTRSVKVLQVEDLSIDKAITFNESPSFAVETLVSLTSIRSVPGSAHAQTGDFAVYSCPNTGATEMELVSRGRVTVFYGKPSFSTLSTLPLDSDTMVDIDSDAFYTSLQKLGYGYNGAFKTLSSTKRKLDQAVAKVTTYGYADDEEPLIVHPSMLDVAFQATFLAKMSPGDEQLWSLHVPTSIKCIRVNPELCASLPSSETQLPLSAKLHPTDSLQLLSSVDVFTEDGEEVLIQVERMAMRSIDSADDRPMFSTTVYDVASPDVSIISSDDTPTSQEKELAATCDKIALQYLQNVRGESTNGDAAANGQESINDLFVKYPGSVDLEVLATLVHGPSIPAEELLQGDILDRLYGEGLGYVQDNKYLARTVVQNSHRYPHAKILEIGGRSGRTAATVLDSIDDKYSSYIYTHASEETLKKAEEFLSGRSQKLAFKPFDTKSTPASQGLEEGSFDVVIAANLFNNTADFNEATANIRRLLKPGGYLVASGLAGHIPARFQILSGNQSSTPAPWQKILESAGFSGFHSSVQQESDAVWPFSVITAQASDDKVSLLREPLSASSTIIDDLVILKNKSAKSSRIAKDLTQILEKFCTNITVLTGLPTDDDNVASGSVFINLADLDDPIFEDLSEEKMEGLKCLFEFSSYILWITEAARTDEPFHSASIGFGRSIAYEMPHLSLQFLDFDKFNNKSSKLISETILRLVAYGEWDNESSLKDKMLWTKEPEIYIENGQQLIPRLLPNVGQNQRINSLRHAITKTVDLDHAAVRISKIGNAPFVLREDPISRVDDPRTPTFRISHSYLSAINAADEKYLFLGFGRDQASGLTAVTVADTNASTVVPIAYIAADVPSEHVPALLTIIADELLSCSLLSKIPAGSHVLVNGVAENDAFTSILTRQMASKNITVAFSHITPWLSTHAVEEVLPADTTHFIDLAIDDDGHDISETIKKALPHDCKRFSAADLFHGQSRVPTQEGENTLLVSLQQAVGQAIKSNLQQSSTVIRPAQLSDHSIPKSPGSIIDWTADKSLTVEVEAINPSRLFSKNKTYVLVGLAGQLGRSIAEWMSRNGAGCICLTSRNPKPDEKWEAMLKKNGTIAKFISMDVTKKRDVKNAINHIKETCPPIAGVANGAAIFHDVPFSEMSLEIMEKVTKPKIDGTRNLDEVLGDYKLDFFIVFSSLTSVLGNSGQSNYTAANAYMTGIVGQRRTRGLAATSLDFGSIIGIGFMERAGDSAREQLIQYGFMAISESDVHQLLAEAIQAGKPEYGANPIVTTGCRTVQDDEEPQVKWFEDPRLQHKVIVQTNAGDAGAGSKKSSLPVKDQLAEATTSEQAYEILKDCFAAKLAQISRLGEGQVSHDVPVVELGIDSLVAVEVRGWFLKELKTDMPVLKVLGGGSVAELCQQALEKLPSNLIPNVGSGGAAKSSKATEPEVKPRAAAAKASKPEKPSKPEQSKKETKTPIETTEEAKQKAPAKEEVAKSEGSNPTNFVRSELVSFPQSRFWFLGLLMEDQTTFNVTFYFRITGSLRIGDLERAVKVISNRHESLRTCFLPHEKEADLAYQKVLPSSLIRLERKKIASLDEIQTEYAAMKAIPFDLASGKLMRLILLTRSPTENYLLVNYHHILMDGVSLQNFLADLEKAYQRQPLGTPPCQVPEFSRIQRSQYENGEFNEDIKFWKNEFPSGHPVLPLLPMAHVSARPPMGVFNVHQVETRVEPELMARIREAARTHHSTTFHFYLAAFQAMLFKFTDTEDLTIGIADANRVAADVEKTIGLLLNLLTLRFKRKDGQIFGETVSESRLKALECLQHSQVPFDILLNELNVPRSSSYSPFFQAFFDYRQGHQEKMTFGSTEWEFMEVHPGRTAYDMTLDITDSADGARVLFRTQASLYDEAGAQLLLKTYIHLLDVVSRDTSKRVDEYPLFSDNELKRAISVGRGPDLKSSWTGGTLPHRIDAVAKQNANKIALRDGHDKVLTYSAVIDRIEAIATALQKAGVGEGSRVLVFEDATADWPCSMLAIMRLGGVYVPLDLRNPLPRLADVANSCEPTAILVDSTTVESVDQINVKGAKVVDVTKVPAKAASHVPNVSRPDAVAAILYTSGSTGKPKGIVVTHEGLRNEIEGYTWRWGLKDETVLQQSAFTFNHSSDQMYTGLVNGGSVYIVPWSKRGDPIEVTKIIQEHGITYTKATPAEYSLWLDYGMDNLKRASKWRFAFGGGETLQATLLKDLATLDLPNLRFFNSYGPTEISISSTKMEVDYRKPPPPGRIPCGYSLPNYTAYILDEQRQPVPIGMPGELWIGGAGVSKGYLNNKELTDQCFTDNPYAFPEYVENGWTRMYRTGDIAHMLEGGEMVFHHRVAGDSQVKIRGLRIELGDIDSNLVKASKGILKDAAVTLRDGDPPFLVAHVVFAPKHQVTDTDAFLKQLLKNLEVPQYMIPVMAIPIDKMPLSNHSKTDRKALKALPLPERAQESQKGEEMELTENMAQLRRLWEDVLNTKQTGLEILPSTSFFTVGGNSLLIVRLQSRIRQVFHVTVRLIDLLDSNTLGAMSRKIEESITVDSLDWDKETALPSDLTLPGKVGNAPIKTSDKSVLVTGAGGFLGKHILSKLIEDPTIAKIHCIGLRDKAGNTPRKLAVESPKIIFHRGDLCDPWLGLGEEKFVALAGEVDSILHMAAARPFWDNYTLLSPNNVAPTKLLMKLAAPRKVPFSYVSSAGVIPGDSAGSKPASVASNKPTDEGAQGYLATRWVCEQVLVKANEKLGVPLTIHRFVPAKNLADEATTTAALDHFVDFADKMSTVPEFEGTSGNFEMTPIDGAAAILANALAHNPSTESTPAQFLHHECDIRIDIDKMIGHILKARGDKGLPTVPGLKWIGDMKRAGLGYFVSSQNLLMESIGDDGKKVTLVSRR